MEMRLWLVVAGLYYLVARNWCTRRVQVACSMYMVHAYTRDRSFGILGHKMLTAGGHGTPAAAVHAHRPHSLT